MITAGKVRDALDICPIPSLVYPPVAGHPARVYDHISHEHTRLHRLRTHLKHRTPLCNREGNKSQCISTRDNGYMHAEIVMANHDLVSIFLPLRECN